MSLSCPAHVRYEQQSRPKPPPAVQAHSALELKILSFLRQAGFPIDPSTSSTIQLVRYFEVEFGCNVMGLLEQEYWEEQLQLDIVDGWFSRIRDTLDDEQTATFDQLLARFQAPPEPPPGEP